MKISDLVKNSFARFSYYRNDMLYYDVIRIYEGSPDSEMVCTFPIDISDKKDIGTATFSNEHKAITLMRYIRKAIENDSIVIYGEHSWPKKKS